MGTSSSKFNYREANIESLKIIRSQMIKRRLKRRNKIINYNFNTIGEDVTFFLENVERVCKILEHLQYFTYLYELKELREFDRVFVLGKKRERSYKVIMSKKPEKKVRDGLTLIYATIPKVYEEEECVICLDEVPDIILLCGHKILCQGCYEDYMKCPVCVI